LTTEKLLTKEKSFTIDGKNKDARVINKEIKDAVNDGYKDITVLNPGSKHNLAVALIDPNSPWSKDHGFQPAPLEKYGWKPGVSITDVKLTFDGSVGYYCAGMCDGPEIHVTGRAGWAVAENLMSGTVIVEKVAGSSTGSCLRGGTLVVKGNAGGRTGLQQKGGTIIIGGDSGFNTGFMMQQGRMVVCGDITHGAGDSMYDGEIFVGGKIGSLGIDTKLVQPSQEEIAGINILLKRYGLNPKNRDWKKIVAGKQLYNYDKLEPLDRRMIL
jgi:glutamate synthase domain-containing protein 3